MSYLNRVLSLEKDLRQKSVLLLGPRQTGKTTFLIREIRPDRSFDLLRAETFARISSDPSAFRNAIEPGDRLILVDEIQKLPALMDEVHALIEERGLRFILTGSSARKLRRSYTSLMGGRLRVRRLFPLVFPELTAKRELDLPRTLQFGSLPPVFFSEDPWLELKDYVGTYLREEIAAEALTRKIEAFSRFLRVAAASNARQVNFEAIGADALVPGRTVREYFTLLQDTLLGTLVEPFCPKRGRKVSSKAKFYLFDCGVTNALLGDSAVSEHTERFGELFEQFIHNELLAYLSYHRQLEEGSLTYWRTQRGEYEVDLILRGDIAIEVKATRHVKERDLVSLRAISEDVKLKKKIVVSRDTSAKRAGDIELLHYTEFLSRLWAGEI